MKDQQTQTAAAAAAEAPAPAQAQQSADVLRLAEAAQQALTDGMVERLSVTGANALEVVDKLNDEDVKDAIVKSLDKLGELNRMGALDTLFETVTLIHAARAAATDSMVERFFIFMEHMINNVGTEELANLAHNARRSMEEAATESARATSPGGLFKTLSLLSKPETQQAMQFLLTFACNMRVRTVDQQGTMTHEE